MTAIKILFKKFTPEQVFMGSVLLVNGGNYLYNLMLGRLLGPEAYADAALLGYPSVGFVFSWHDISVSNYQICCGFFRE